MFQLFFLHNTVFAGPIKAADTTAIRGPMIDMGDAAGFEQSDWENSLPSYIANIIKIFLSLLGVIFTILIIYGGYTWMTAGGSEDKVQKAKDIIQRSVIGFVIILSAYVITYFVFKSIATGGGVAGPG